MKSFFALLLLALVGCSKNYPMTYIGQPDRSKIAIEIKGAAVPQTTIYSDSELIYSSVLWYPSDTFYVADSSKLVAYRLTYGTIIRFDTIATAGLVWTIQ